MLAVLLLTPFNNGGVSMTKKTLSTLSLFAGTTSWKNSATKATLALSDLWSLLCLEEHAQQAPSAACLVRALDCRGLHAETTDHSERSQRFHSQAYHRTLAATSSTKPYRAIGVSLLALRWNFHQPAQGSLCRDGY
jgi:hypothetical protein